MDHTEHVCMVGRSAELLAEKYMLDTVSTDYFYTDRRHQQLLHAQNTTNNNSSSLDHDIAEVDLGDRVPQETGTVGCVCLYKGNLAAATSTGGDHAQLYLHCSSIITP